MQVNIATSSQAETFLSMLESFCVAHLPIQRVGNWAKLVLSLVFRIQVTVFRGSSRVPASAVPIATADIALAPIVLGERVHGSVVLTPVPVAGEAQLPPGVAATAADSSGDGSAAPGAASADLMYSGSLSIEVEPQQSLLHAARGGRVLSLDALSLRNLPHHFRVPVPELEEGPDGQPPVQGTWEPLPELRADDDVTEALQYVVDADENKHRYILQLHLPASHGAASRDFTVPDGVMRLVKLPAAVKPEAAAETEVESKEEVPAVDTAAAAEPPQYAWRVEWPGRSTFLSRGQVQALLENTRAGGAVDATIQRMEVIPVEDDEVGIHAAPEGEMAAGELTADSDALTAPLGEEGSTPLRTLAPGRFVEPTFGCTGCRVVKRDLLWRGGVSLVLDALAREDAVSTGSLQVSMAPLPGSKEEIDAEEAAAATRDSEWEAFAEDARTKAEEAAAALEAAASSRAASPKGGKGGKANKKDKKSAKKSPRKDKKKDKKGKKSPRGGKKGKKSPRGGKSPRGAAAEEEPEMPSGPPPHPYALYGTFITVAASVDRPLVMSAPPPPVAELTAAELVAPRGPPPNTPPPLGASEEFRRDVALAVHAIAEQYVHVVRRLQAEHGAGAGTKESRRRELLAALNNAGVYDALKARLKRTVVRVVRERFHQRAPFATDSEDALAARDVFLSQLYTYLLGQSHRAMHVAFDLAQRAVQQGDVPPPSDPLAPDAVAAAAPSEAMARTVTHAQAIAALPGSVSDLLRDSVRSAARPAEAGRPSSPVSESLWALQATAGGDPSSTQTGFRPSSPPPAAEEAPAARSLRLALEAEFEGDMTRAAALLQARVAAAEQRAARGGRRVAWDAAVWEDYGEFLLRTGDTGRAAECFREAVSISPTRVSALVLLGATQAVRGHAPVAIPLLRTAQRVLQGDLPLHDAAGDVSSCVARNVPYPEALIAVLLSLVQGGYVPPVGGAARGDALLVQTGVVPDPGDAQIMHEAEAGDTNTQTAGKAVLESVSLLHKWGIGWDGQHDVGAHVAAGQGSSPAEVSRSGDAGESKHGEDKGVQHSAAGLLSEAPRDAADYDAYIVASTWAARYAGGLLPISAAAASLGRACVTDMTVPRAVHIRLYLLEAEACFTAWKRGVQSALGAALDAVSAALQLDSNCREAWALQGEIELAGDSTGSARKSLEMAVGGWDSTTGTLAGGTLSSVRLLLRIAGVYLSQHEAGVQAGGAGGVPTTPSIHAAATYGSDGKSADEELEGKEGDAQDAALSATQKMAGEASSSLAAAAQEVYLRVARATGWAVAWAGAGKAALRQGLEEEAEAALSEANVRDNHNSAVWGLLVLLCVRSDPPRHAEAAAALAQALKYGLAVPRNGALLRELVGAYADLGKNAIAQQLLRRVLAAPVDEDDHGAKLEVAWAQHALGVLLVQDGLTEEGVSHLSSVLRSAGDLGDGELEAAAARDLAGALRAAGHHQDAEAVEADFLH